MGKMVISGHLAAFNGKRVLVTGDTGFKGSWLSLLLSELGADVVGYALPPERDNDHFNLLKLNKIVHHVDGDIRDLSSMRKVFDEFKPEYLFHLAAQSLVRTSYESPKMTFDTNVGGSVNVLEIVRSSSSLKSVVYVTSDKCYKNKEWLWGYRENDELGGHDPYSASKAAAEIVFSSYLDSFLSERSDLGVASVRAGNVIGGGDWSSNRIIPDCITSLQKGEVIELRNPSATRPWQHVLDPLAGYLQLAARLYDDPKKFSGSWNFGPDSCSNRTVHELTSKVVACWGSGEVRVVGNNDKMHEARFLQLNCDKSHQILDWHPRWRFDESVSKTVAWYKDVMNGVSAFDVSRRQINDYMEAKND